MRVTVIPDDKTIIVDGVALAFDFAADANLHALQWYGAAGTIEPKVGAAEYFDDFEVVRPFVDAHAAEVARLAAEAEAKRLAEEAAKQAAEQGGE